MTITPSKLAELLAKARAANKIPPIILDEEDEIVNSLHVGGFRGSVATRQHHSAGAEGEVPRLKRRNKRRNRRGMKRKRRSQER